MITPENQNIPVKIVEGSPGNTPNPRRHDLDALRAVAMFLGICLHAMMAYSGIAWAVMDNQRDDVFESVINLIHGFRMPLFFLVSGFFTAMLACRRGWAGMLGNRAGRILLAIFICMFTIIPLDRVVQYLALVENASHPHGKVFQAIQKGDTEQLSKILNNGSGSLLEETEKRMNLTPLTWSVLCESDSATGLLLEQGANPMASNRMGFNALSIAALLGKGETLKILLKKGGDPFRTTVKEKSEIGRAHV